MFFEEALIFIGLPLILIITGYLKNRADLTTIGGIALLITGVFIFASPLTVQHNLNYTAEQSYVWEGYCNITDLFYNATIDEYEMQNQIVNCTRNMYNTTYYYQGIPLEENNNLILGLVLSMFGLLAMTTGIVTMRR